MRRAVSQGICVLSYSVSFTPAMSDVCGESRFFLYWRRCYVCLRFTTQSYSFLSGVRFGWLAGWLTGWLTGCFFGFAFRPLGRYRRESASRSPKTSAENQFAQKRRLLGKPQVVSDTIRGA